MELPNIPDLEELDKKKLSQLKAFLIKYIHTIDVIVRDNPL